uniref:Uncharacterized protein n=1 Tax=Echinococcus canadensis TaxID=519352 RepID=A0A915EXW5_9CEST
MHHALPTPFLSYSTTLHFQATPHIELTTTAYWIELAELLKHLLRVAPVGGAVSMKQCQLSALGDRYRLSNNKCREVRRQLETISQFQVPCPHFVSPQSCLNRVLFVVMLRLYAGVSDIHIESLLTSKPQKEFNYASV